MMQGSITEKVLVSVQCLVYNHALYLRQCLDGFVMQKTSFKYEVIVHDDASTDGSSDIIREYAQKYPGLFKIIIQTENIYSKGISPTRKYILPLCTGKYIAMCEGDDYWTDPYKLQKQVDYMEAHPEFGLCYTDYNDQIESGEIIPSMFERQHVYRPKTYEQHLLQPGYLAPMTWLYRRDLQDMLIKSRIFTDGTYAFMLEFMHNTQVAYIPITTATYREHAGSASSPISVQSLFIYSKGIFDTQVFYSQKYPCSSELKAKVYMHGYLDKLPIAIMANQEEFVEEARTFMKSQGLEIDLIIRELKQGEMRKRSKAYRLGKVILRPFKWLKDIIEK